MNPETEKDFTKKQQIGEGGSSIVYKCQYVKANSVVAMKKVQLDPNYPEDLEALQIEIGIHKKIDYPLIAQFFAASYEENTVSIFMEYCGKETLLSYLNSIGQLSEMQAKKFFIHILSSLQYIHSLKKVHGDIKLENVIIDSNMNAILIDFGLCTKFGAENPGFGGTIQYTAPEVFKGERDYTGASDIWSAGIILYAMLFGCLPFDSESDDDDSLIKVIQTKPVVFNNDIIVSSDAKDLLLLLLAKEPSERITIKEIATQPWIANSQYVNLLNPVYTNQKELKIMPTSEEEIDQRIVDEIVSHQQFKRDEIIKHLLEYNETEDVLYYKIRKMQLLKKLFQQFRNAQYRPPRKVPLTYMVPFAIPNYTEKRRYERISKV